jgi:hypothetical protein
VPLQQIPHISGSPPFSRHLAPLLAISLFRQFRLSNLAMVHVLVSTSSCLFAFLKSLTAFAKSPSFASNFPRCTKAAEKSGCNSKTAFKSDIAARILDNP